MLYLPTKWEHHGITFRMTAQTCEMTVRKVFCIAGPIIKAELVRDVIIDNFHSAGIKLLLIIQLHIMLLMLV